MKRDSVYQGRVTFVQNNTARVGQQRVQLDQITLVERSYESALGGKRTGFFIGGGIGLFVGYALGSIAHQLGETGGGCFGCGFAALLTAAIFGTIGAMIGSMVEPPTREWAIIWQR